MTLYREHTSQNLPREHTISQNRHSDHTIAHRPIRRLVGEEDAIDEQLNPSHNPVIRDKLKCHKLTNYY